jgi:fructokinase
MNERVENRRPGGGDGIEALVFGEALWDVFDDAERLGGAPLNFAVRLAELGHETALITRLGADARGDAAVDALCPTRVSLSLIQRDPKAPTGIVRVTLSSGGDPEYVIVPDAAYDRIAAQPGILDVAAGSACLYFGTLAQRSEISRRTLFRLIRRLPAGAMRFCDINLRRGCYDRETVLDSVADATILKLNENEVAPVAALAGGPDAILDFAAYTLRTRPKMECVVVTLGERGAVAMTSAQTVYAPGRRTDVVDLVGAGDAFAAAFVHGTLQGWPLARRLSFANAVGAVVAGQAGATAAIDSAAVAALAGNAGDWIIDERFRARMAV